MTTLRELLQREEILVVPGCHDPLSARIIERLGFNATFLGGWAVGASLAISEPCISLTEMATLSKCITDGLKIPLIVDAAACWGDGIMARRTTREFEKAGVAGMHIEDELTPKRAGYHKGEYNLITVEEMINKINICLSSRQNRDFIVIARTDAGRDKNETFDKAIERANVYARETEVDLLLTFPRTMEEIELAPKKIEKGLVFVASEGLGRPIPTIEDLRRFGYKVVLYPVTSVLAMYESIVGKYTNLKQDGHSHLALEQAGKIAQEVMQTIALPELWSIEQSFYKKR
jgi:methylisocitrate lyase